MFKYINFLLFLLLVFCSGCDYERTILIDLQNNQAQEIQDIKHTLEHLNDAYFRLQKEFCKDKQDNLIVIVGRSYYNEFAEERVLVLVDKKYKLVTNNELAQMGEVSSLEEVKEYMKSNHYTNMPCK